MVGFLYELIFYIFIDWLAKKLKMDSTLFSFIIVAIILIAVIYFISSGAVRIESKA